MFENGSTYKVFIDKMNFELEFCIRKGDHGFSIYAIFFN